MTFPGGADTRERADSPRPGGWSIADFVSAKRYAGELCFLWFVPKEVPARHEGYKLAILEKVCLPGCAGPRELPSIFQKRFSPCTKIEGQFEVFFPVYQMGQQEQPFFFPYKMKITLTREKLPAQQDVGRVLAFLKSNITNQPKLLRLASEARPSPNLSLHNNRLNPHQNLFSPPFSPSLSTCSLEFSLLFTGSGNLFPPATACFHRSLWIVEGEALKAASFPPISPQSLHHIPPAVETSDCFSLLHFFPTVLPDVENSDFPGCKPTCPILHISTGPTITTILYLFFLYRKGSKQK